MIFFNENFFWKDSYDFWLRKFTLKVQNWHFLMNCHQMETQNLVISFDCSWFLTKNLAYVECPIMKFHYQNSSNVQAVVLNFLILYNFEPGIAYSLRIQKFIYLHSLKHDLNDFLQFWIWSLTLFDNSVLCFDYLSSNFTQFEDEFILNIKVSKSRKQIMMFLILPKNEQNSLRILSWVCFVYFWQNPGLHNLLWRFTDL